MKFINTLPAVLVVVSAIIVVSCSKTDKVTQELLRPVRYQQVAISDSTITRTFSGVSKAGVEINLSFKVNGNVQSINVNVGDKVKKGQRIASLDKTDLQLIYEQAEVGYNNAYVQMHSARSAFERTSALYENNNVSLQDYELARTAYESAKALVSSNRQSMKLAKGQLDYTCLYAPIEGVVTEIMIENNENTVAGKTVVEINSGNDLEVIVGIPETYISRIKKNSRVNVTFISQEKENFTGKVSEISYNVNKKTSTFPVTVSIIQPSETIRPGMTADIIFDFKNGHKKACVVVPSHTVAEDRNGRFVYTVTDISNNNATIRKKTVRLGELICEGFEVIEGLKRGEFIVTAGISKLSDGMSVKLLN